MRYTKIEDGDKQTKEKRKGKKYKRQTNHKRKTWKEGEKQRRVKRLGTIPFFRLLIFRLKFPAICARFWRSSPFVYIHIKRIRLCRIHSYFFIFPLHYSLLNDSFSSVLFCVSLFPLQILSHWFSSLVRLACVYFSFSWFISWYVFHCVISIHFLRLVFVLFFSLTFVHFFLSW